MKSYIKGALIFCISILLIIMYLFSFLHPQNEIFKKKQSVQNYDSKALPLPDISNQEIIENEAIFFVETSVKSSNKNKIRINARQACSVESAARLNPNRTIRLLYASTGNFNFSENTESDRFLQALISYSNVRINHVDYAIFFKNTPLENLYNSGFLESSKYPVEHASDVLRLLLLWKYGGIYLDLDVVVLKNLQTLALNFAGYESSDIIANGVLSFNSSGGGHELALKCLLHLQHNFNGEEWSTNGPLVITKILHEVCRSKEKEKSRLCGSFKVHEPNAFYPILWQHWRKYFEEDTEENIEKLLAKSYGAHVWNHLSGNRDISLDSRVVYLKIARKFCPKIVENCHKTF